jgi:hypothetical protein
MTKKEKAIIDGWLAEIKLYEQAMRDCWKELGALFVSRGGGDAPTISFLTHFDYLQTSEDRATRDKAKIIWTSYYEAEAQIKARRQLAQALSGT